MFVNDLERYGDRPALITHDGGLSFLELTAVGDRIAGFVQKRSLVFCVCKNVPEAIAGYIGFLRRGVVPIMLQPTLDAALFDSLCRTYRPQYIWCPKGFRDAAAVYEYGEYALLEGAAGDVPQLYPELALLLTTSGSTGSPKLVRQTYQNIESNTRSIIEYLGIRSSDRAITTLPLSYTYGLSIVQSHLAAGASIILTQYGILQKEFWSLFREKQAATFGGVPYTYEMLDKLRFLRMELPSLRYLTQAGGKLSKELHYKFAKGLREQGKVFVVMYGAAEATARMGYVPAASSMEKAGSIGIAIPGGRFELMDADGETIDKTDTVGELIYYGDNVTLGYAQCREDLAKSDERHGRLETGDMAQVDADGYYYVVGRKKRFLKIYGNRVNLMEIEGILAKQGYDCACVGEDDHMRIYTTSVDTEAIVAYIADVTGINHVAFSAIHIDAIPHNDAGKVLYSELK